MPCNPNDNNLSPQILPVPPLTPDGFGLPFVPESLPYPDIKLPVGIPEDILLLVQTILARIPGITLHAAPDHFSKTVLDVIASLLNQLGPYLGIYNFFQALLNMILCIMDVLCSLMNPFALIRAINRLFKRCLPDFLNLFPWLALISMVTALLLLLLALIEYLVQEVLAIIADILINLDLLAKAVQVNASSSDMIAAARKIAMLLCMLEQLFAILVAFQSILAVIEALAQRSGRGVCGSSSSSDDNLCCSTDVCPDFIRNNPDGLTGTFGRIIYHSQVDNDLSGFPFGFVMSAAREESWQFVDSQTQTYNIKDIITPISGNIFWPEGMSYKATSNIKKVPYSIDMTIFIDPAAFGHNDGLGMRHFVINDVRFIDEPYIGEITYDGSITNSITNGTAPIQGGVVFEADGKTPYLINGQQATFNQFIHEPIKIGYPISEDGYFIDNITYTLNINHEALLEQNLITLGCIPSVSIESEISNIVAQTAVPQLSSVFSRIGNLPDINGSITCMQNSINKFRLNASPANGALMQAEMMTCLNSLKNQTLASYTAAIAGGVSPFTSKITLDTNLQFVGLPITVSLTLMDPSGTIITQTMPIDAQNQIASLIDGYATFGTVSPFIYDGYQDFTAEITTQTAGVGEITVSFDNNIISVVIGQDDDTVSTSIENNIQSYQFVGSIILGLADTVPRRDEMDIE